MEDIILYEWQKTAIERAKNEDNLALFCEVGTGKSCATIQFIRNHCNKAMRIKRTLILGPVAVVYNWQDEIAKFSNIDKKNIFVSTGNGESRSKKVYEFIKTNPNAIIITNYESLRNSTLFQTLKMWQPEIICFDESQMLKSPDALQSKLSYELSLQAHNKYLLSGTPVLNTPMDIFMQYKILDGGETFGSSFFRFRAYYFVNENAARPWMTFPSWVPNPHKMEELHQKIMTKAVRVKSSECLDLPPRIEQTYYVEMGKEQKRIYGQMKKEFIAWIDDNKGKQRAIVAQLALTKALRLQEILSGYCKTDDGKIISIIDNPRIKATKDILSQIISEHKCIIWTNFVQNYRDLEKLCEEMGIKYVKITGEENAKQKHDNNISFETDDSVRVVIAHPKAGGIGINLVAASYSIIYSSDFSLQSEKQSEGRNFRRGSEKHERIIKIRLCCKGTIDEIVMKALKGKQSIADLVIDNYKEL